MDQIVPVRLLTFISSTVGFPIQGQSLGSDHPSGDS